MDESHQQSPGEASSSRPSSAPTPPGISQARKKTATTSGSVDGSPETGGTGGGSQKTKASRRTKASLASGNPTQSSPTDLPNNSKATDGETTQAKKEGAEDVHGIAPSKGTTSSSSQPSHVQISFGDTSTIPDEKKRDDPQDDDRSSSTQDEKSQNLEQRLKATKLVEEAAKAACLWKERRVCREGPVLSGSLRMPLAQLEDTAGLLLGGGGGPNSLSDETSSDFISETLMAIRRAQVYLQRLNELEGEDEESNIYAPGELPHQQPSGRQAIPEDPFDEKSRLSRDSRSLKKGKSCMKSMRKTRETVCNEDDEEAVHRISSFDESPHALTMPFYFSHVSRPKTLSGASCLYQNHYRSTLCSSSSIASPKALSSPSSLAKDHKSDSIYSPDSSSFCLDTSRTPGGLSSPLAHLPSSSDLFRSRNYSPLPFSLRKTETGERSSTAVHPLGGGVTSGILRTLAENQGNGRRCAFRAFQEVPDTSEGEDLSPQARSILRMSIDRTSFRSSLRGTRDPRVSRSHSMRDGEDEEEQEEAEKERKRGLLAGRGDRGRKEDPHKNPEIKARKKTVRSSAAVAPLGNLSSSRLSEDTPSRHTTVAVHPLTTRSPSTLSKGKRREEDEDSKGGVGYCPAVLAVSTSKPGSDLLRGITERGGLPETGGESLQPPRIAKKKKKSTSQGDTSDLHGSRQQRERPVGSLMKKTGEQEKPQRKTRTLSTSAKEDEESIDRPHRTDRGRLSSSSSSSSRGGIRTTQQPPREAHRLSPPSLPTPGGGSRSSQRTSKTKDFFSIKKQRRFRSVASLPLIAYRPSILLWEEERKGEEGRRLDREDPFSRLTKKQRRAQTWTPGIGARGSSALDGEAFERRRKRGGIGKDSSRVFTGSFNSNRLSQRDISDGDDERVSREKRSRRTRTGTTDTDTSDSGEGALEGSEELTTTTRTTTSPERKKEKRKSVGEEKAIGKERKEEGEDYEDENDQEEEEEEEDPEAFLLNYLFKDLGDKARLMNEEEGKDERHSGGERTNFSKGGRGMYGMSRRIDKVTTFFHLLRCMLPEALRCTSTSTTCTDTPTNCRRSDSTPFRVVPSQKQGSGDPKSLVRKERKEGRERREKEKEERTREGRESSQGIASSPNKVSFSPSHGYHLCPSSSSSLPPPPRKRGEEREKVLRHSSQRDKEEEEETRDEIEDSEEKSACEEEERDEEEEEDECTSLVMGLLTSRAFVTTFGRLIQRTLCPALQHQHSLGAVKSSDLPHTRDKENTRVSQGTKREKGTEIPSSATQEETTSSVSSPEDRLRRTRDAQSERSTKKKEEEKKEKEAKEEEEDVDPERAAARAYKEASSLKQQMKRLLDTLSPEEGKDATKDFLSEFFIDPERRCSLPLG